MALKQHPGRILALDLGERRIGVAVSDETRAIAASLGVIQRSSRAADFEKIGRMAREQKATLIVVGLPLLPDGAMGETALWAQDYAADLARNLGLETVLWDESLTTVVAEASLRERGFRGKKRRARVDAAAAAFILQSYLDAHAPNQTPEPQ